MKKISFSPKMILFFKSPRSSKNMMLWRSSAGRWKRRWSGSPGETAGNSSSSYCLIPSYRSFVQRTYHLAHGMAKVKVFPNGGAQAQISHPHGLERFDRSGAALIDIVNREYCKKLILQLPGQDHPFHKHHQKEETFHLLMGDLDAEVDRQVKVLKPGERLTIFRGQIHAFRTHTGMIMEKISTAHLKNDSIYQEPDIPPDPAQRKTPVLL